jgi:hypothetical protein
MPNEEFRQTLRRLGIEANETLKHYWQQEKYLQQRQKALYRKIKVVEIATKNVTNNYPLDSPEKDKLLAAFQKKSKFLHNQLHCVYAESHYFRRKRFEEELRLINQK